MKNKKLNVAFDMALHKIRMRQSELARRLNTSPALVSHWMYNRIPAEWVLKVEKETGCPRHKLRPDLYPKPDKQ